MLPNHAPLQVAEQFGTLASLYPGRIDLGLGRAPGTDQPTARALRRYFDSADAFPQRRAWSCWAISSRPRRASRCAPCPVPGIEVPVWLLGSSLFSATLAAPLGLPFAFASHFAPDAMDEALALYRRDFRPSARLAAALRDAGAQRGGGRQRRRGAAPVHHPAAELRQPAPRPAGPDPAADRRHRGVLDTRREADGGARAGLRRGGRRRHRARRHRRRSSPGTSPTNCCSRPTSSIMPRGCIRSRSPPRCASDLRRA